jgi:hypothetical protein
MIWSEMRFKFRWGPAAVCTVLLAMILAAAALVSSGSIVGTTLYTAFAPFCHQQVERSWALFGVALPVCVRCLGFYSGAWLAALLGIGCSKRWLAAAVGLGLAGWALEVTSFAMVPAALRFALGFALGWTALAVLRGGPLSTRYLGNRFRGPAGSRC